MHVLSFIFIHIFILYSTFWNICNTVSICSISHRYIAGISFGNPEYTFGGGIVVGAGFVFGAGIVAYTWKTQEKV